MTADTTTRAGALLHIGDRQLDLPLVTGTEGDDALDIGALRAETGLITLDPGYGNTGACSSAITYLGGESGMLRYRGYLIAQWQEMLTSKESRLGRPRQVYTGPSVRDYVSIEQR